MHKAKCVGSCLLLRWPVPKRLRYFLQRDQTALNSALRLFSRAIRSQLIQNSALLGPTVSVPSHSLQIGAVAFIHWFGSSLNEHVHVGFRSMPAFELAHKTELAWSDCYFTARVRRLR